MEQLINIALANIPSDGRSARLFHGRGKKIPQFEHICIDLFENALLITLFKEITEDFLAALISGLAAIKVDHLFVQRRFLPGSPVTSFKGDLKGPHYATEEGLKYQLKFDGGQNIGFFPDMYPGRLYLLKNAQAKKVLNLFSYTCSLSVAALKGGASFVVNVDMSKAALAVGEVNHQLNGLHKNVRFLPFDILTSWKRIISPGPYDIVVIDPPTYQGESFKVERDYYKIVKRLDQLTSPHATVMACLNTPYLTTQFLHELFSLHAPQFTFSEVLYSAFSGMEMNPEEGLKIVIFKKGTPS